MSNQERNKRDKKSVQNKEVSNVIGRKTETRDSDNNRLAIEYQMKGKRKRMCVGRDENPLTKKRMKNQFCPESLLP